MADHRASLLPLPAPPERKGLYAPARITGNLMYVSGHPPLRPDGTMVTGMIGRDITQAEGRHAARLTALAILATMRRELGTLDRVVRVVKTLGMLYCTPDFQQHPDVMNGYSEVLEEVFGPAGVGARSAVGMGSLPFETSVEIEVIVEILAAEPAPVPRATNATFSFEDLGVPRLINAMGTMTALGGSRMSAEVTAAMAQAAAQFVDMNALLAAAGKEVARLCRVPTGYGAHIVSGSSAGISAAVAACITGTDRASALLLPTGTNTTVVVDGAADARWLSAARCVGGQVQSLGTPVSPMTAAQLRDALSPAPACVLLFAGTFNEHSLPLEEVLSLAHAAGVPVVLDAAAQLPPLSNLWRWTALGVDAVVYSGGKEIAGPQTSGFVLARSALVGAMALNCSPREGAICRGMKVSKECIAGLVVALRAFVAAPDRLQEYSALAHLMASRLAVVKGVAVRVVAPGPPDIQPNCIPRVYVEVFAPPQGPSAGAAAEATSTHAIYGHSLDHSTPLDIKAVSPGAALAARLAAVRVLVNTWEKGIMLNPQTLTSTEAEILVRNIASEVAKMLHEGQLVADPSA